MSSNPKAEPASNIRLDKWLWAARFYKTRAIAQSMIEGGKVHYNGQRCKPSRTVVVGAVIRLRQGMDERDVEVLAISEKRGSAPQAQLLYRETPESEQRRVALYEARKAANALMPLSTRRPDKKERRQIMQFKHGDGGEHHD